MSAQMQAMARTVSDLLAPRKGILAADESPGTLEKRFDNVNVPCTEETRREYRELLFSTPGLSAYVSGVILFEETLKQKTAAGVALPQLLIAQGMVPGIKVDRGTVSFAGFPGEKVTQGLDELRQRLTEYKQLGVCFAKWRAVIAIGAELPTTQAIVANADALARYAALCQEQGLVPIVEPEVLMDGDHSLATCARVTEDVLESVFDSLYQQRVLLECMLLKPNMVVPGTASAELAAPEQVARATLACLKRTVPAAVPGIVFLSGGQSEASATANLNAINSRGEKAPWVLSFSYGRALQAPVLQAWRGDGANQGIAQQALYLRARLNSAAREGKYTSGMENERPAG